MAALDGPKLSADASKAGKAADASKPGKAADASKAGKAPPPVVSKLLGSANATTAEDQPVSLANRNPLLPLDNRPALPRRPRSSSLGPMKVWHKAMLGSLSLYFTERLFGVKFWIT